MNSIRSFTNTLENVCWKARAVYNLNYRFALYPDCRSALFINLRDELRRYE